MAGIGGNMILNGDYITIKCEVNRDYNYNQLHDRIRLYVYINKRLSFSGNRKTNMKLKN